MKRQTAPCPFCSATNARLCPYHSDDPTRLHDLWSERDAFEIRCASAGGEINALRADRDALADVVAKVAAHFEGTDAPLGIEARAALARVGR